MPENDNAEGAYGELNAAKQLAWGSCSLAVRYLIAVIADDEMDPEIRISAAAELLNFALRGPN